MQTSLLYTNYFVILYSSKYTVMQKLTNISINITLWGGYLPFVAVYLRTALGGFYINNNDLPGTIKTS